MRNSLNQLAVWTACVLGFAAIASAQVSGIEGTVKDADGNPVVGAFVRIERLDIKGKYDVKTDKKGHWGHYGLPLGDYKLTLEVDGKAVDGINKIHTSLGDPKNVPFKLKPPKPAQTAAAAPGAGGGQAAPQAPPPEQDRSMSKEQKAAMEKANKEREAQMAKNKELNDAFQAGKAGADTKNWDAAIEGFKKASGLEGGNQVVVWMNLADAYANAAKAKPTEAVDLRAKSIDAYKKVFELKQDDPSAYNNYALVLAANKQIPDAQAALEKAAQLDPPGAGRYYYNLGAVLVNTGQNEPAGIAFKKAIDADPTYADAWYQYGISLTGQAKTDASGKVTAAPGTVEAFQKYLDLKPDGPMAEQAKGMIGMLGGTIQTTYSNPSAPKGKAAPKKK